MKTEEQISKALDNVDTENCKFHNMTYEQGVEEALIWVLGGIEDGDFEYEK